MFLPGFPCHVSAEKARGCFRAVLHTLCARSAPAGFRAFGTHCAPQRPWDPLTELCYQEGPVDTVQAQSPSPGPLEQSLWHGGRVTLTVSWLELPAHPGGQLPAAWRLLGDSYCVCLGGEAAGAASRDPRDAGGLFSVLTGLSTQLYILTEAEEPLIGCMGLHFQALTEGKGKQPHEEALKGLGVLGGFWRPFVTILADLCSQKGACIRACGWVINSGTGARRQVGGGAGPLCWVLTEPATLGLGRRGCRSCSPSWGASAPGVPDAGIPLAPSLLPRGSRTQHRPWPHGHHLPNHATSQTSQDRMAPESRLRGNGGE